MNDFEDRLTVIAMLFSEFSKSYKEIKKKKEIEKFTPPKLSRDLSPSISPSMHRHLLTRFFIANKLRMINSKNFVENFVSSNLTAIPCFL